MNRLSLVLLLLVFGIGIVHADAQGGMPYIYYYDDYLKGTIIERADGTDSRFVPYHSITWSPSGRWFVGSVGGEPGWSMSGGSETEKLYRVRADGTQAVEIFEQKSRYDYRHKFAPHGDVLAILDVEINWETNDPQWNALMKLVDFSTAQTIASFTLSNINADELYYSSDIYWQPDGLKAFFDVGFSLVELSVDGPVGFESKKFLNKDVMTFEKGFRLKWPYGSITNTFQITDQVTGLSFIFNDASKPFPDGFSPRYQMRWNDWRTYGLITGEACKYEDYKNVCEPPQTWSINWPHKQIRLLPQPISISFDEMRRPSVVFSPDGRYALYTNEARVIDLETQTITSRLYDATEWVWLNENILSLSSDSIGKKTVLFDPQTQLISTTSFNSRRVYPSPDGRLFGLLTDPPVIKNRAGKVIREWLPHSHSTNSYRTPDRYQWHSDGEWVIGEYMIFFAGGGMGPLAGTVFDIAGTVSRELPTNGNARFLPENVIPYLLPGQPQSFKPDPVSEIAFENRAVGTGEVAFGWHISDSTRFAFYTYHEMIYGSVVNEQLVLDKAIPVSFETLEEAAEFAPDYNFNPARHEAQNECLKASSGPYEANTLLANAETGEDIIRLWTTGAIVALSSDGHWLATVSHPKIQLWDVSAYC